jgi:hypothetical protein
MQHVTPHHNSLHKSTRPLPPQRHSQRCQERCTMSSAHLCCINPQTHVSPDLAGVQPPHPPQQAPAGCNSDSTASKSTHTTIPWHAHPERACTGCASPHFPTRPSRTPHHTKPHPRDSTAHMNCTNGPPTPCLPSPRVAQTQESEITLGCESISRNRERATAR